MATYYEGNEARSFSMEQIVVFYEEGWNKKKKRKKK
jgi:hypothetical protein